MLERLLKPGCWGGSLELRVQLFDENARKTKENNYEFTKAMNNINNNNTNDLLEKDGGVKNCIYKD